MAKLVAFLVVATLLSLIVARIWQRLGRRRRGEFIDNYLYRQFLDQRLAARRPELMPDQREQVFSGLRDYFHLCNTARQRMVAMPSPTTASEGIKRAWRLACAREQIDPKKPERLPRLFALDAALLIAGGFVYQLDCMAAGRAGTGYCASHIGCGGGCSGDSGSADSDGGSGDGGGGGCGGD